MSELVPKSLLDGVVRRLDPVAVYLFGSRARGEAREDSDYDLYVVLPDDCDPASRTSQAIAEARHGFRGAVDIVLMRESRFLRRKTMVGALAEVVAHEGVEVYRRAG